MLKSVIVAGRVSRKRTGGIIETISFVGVEPVAIDVDVCVSIAVVLQVDNATGVVFAVYCVCSALSGVVWDRDRIWACAILLKLRK
jgi:molybdenum cofactor biosynthesis enzyme